MAQIDLKALFKNFKNCKVDKLIDLVTDRPVIWDRTVEGYGNGDVTTPAWQKICSHLFDEYDRLGAKEKQDIEKEVKDNWRKTQATWERKDRKIKVAKKEGRVYMLKNSARHERLKSLFKDYDKHDCTMKNKGNGKIVLSSSGIFNPDAENVLNTIKDCTSNAGVSVDDRKSQKHNLTLSSSRKRKSDNNSVMSFKPNLNQVKHLNHGGAAEAFSFTPNKLARTSSIKNRETEHIKSPAQVQLQKREQIPRINSKTEILPLNSDAYVEVTTKLTKEVKSPGQLIKREANPRPSTSTESYANSEVVEMTDVNAPPGEMNVSQTPQKRPAPDSDSNNEKLDNFCKTLKPHIETFDKSQMINFFFEIIKPLLEDLSDSQNLDFLIRALTLIKKYSTEIKNEFE